MRKFGALPGVALPTRTDAPEAGLPAVKARASAVSKHAKIPLFLLLAAGAAVGLVASRQKSEQTKQEWKVDRQKEVDRQADADFQQHCKQQTAENMANPILEDPSKMNDHYVWLAALAGHYEQQGGNAAKGAELYKQALKWTDNLGAGQSDLDRIRYRVDAKKARWTSIIHQLWADGEPDQGKAREHQQKAHDAAQKLFAETVKLEPGIEHMTPAQKTAYMQNREWEAMVLQRLAAEKLDLPETGEFDARAGEITAAMNTYHGMKGRQVLTDDMPKNMVMNIRMAQVTTDLFRSWHDEATLLSANRNARAVANR